MARNSYGESMWQCSFWPEDNLDGPSPSVWIRAAGASHAASLFRIDLAEHAKGRKGTIIVSDKNGREFHRAAWNHDSQK